jgi:hypothetical protein
MALTSTSNTRSIDGIRPATSPPILSVKRKEQLFLHKYVWQVIIVAFLLIVTLSAGIYIYHRHQISGLRGVNELKYVENEVSKHYLLPNNEVPALATVTNSSKLTTPFLKHAKDGDEILIYEKNQIAIIYRPSIDRIVAVGPVDIVPSASN